MFGSDRDHLVLILKIALKIQVVVIALLYSMANLGFAKLIIFLYKMLKSRLICPSFGTKNTQLTLFESTTCKVAF